MRRYQLAFFALLLVGLVSPLLTQVQANQAKINGIFYFPIKEMGKKMGLKFYTIAKDEQVGLKGKTARFTFRKDSATLTLNGHIILLEYPVKCHNGKFYLSQHDYKNTLAPLLLPHAQGFPPKLYNIVIDAGHGGKDPGTTNTGLNLKEKEMALDVAKRLQKLLISAGYSATLTRSNDTFIELGRRSSIANAANADLFVSVHFNSVGSNKQNVAGIETYVLRSINNQNYSGNKNNAWNVLVGYYVQTSLRQYVNGNDRGLKRANFKVLKDITCPGILVEAGFISNPKEASKISSAAYRQKLAQGIMNGILQYNRSLNNARAIVKNK